MATQPASVPLAGEPGRAALVVRGCRLAWFTIGWNALEGLVAIASGLVAGSIALIGFGADSYVEVFAGVVVVWRLAAERRGREISEAAERRAVRLIAMVGWWWADPVAALGWCTSPPGRAWRTGRPSSQVGTCGEPARASVCEACG
jgi:hypothetical protein